MESAREHGRLRTDANATPRNATMSQSRRRRPPPTPLAALLPLALCGLVLPACGGSSPADPAAPVPPPGERALRDRPDEVRGSQIHVFYVLCANCEDRRLDVDGTLERSIRSLQTWLGNQTGGRTLRIDSYRGRPDITFFRLGERGGELRGKGSALVNHISDALRDAGFEKRDTKLLIYYDGTNDATCGSSQQGGRAAAQYLRGITPGGRACISTRFAPWGQASWWELGAIHEVLHTLGFVDPSAPNHDPAVPFHVADSRNDLMYGGEHWTPYFLDSGKDDYFGSAVPGELPNLLASPFLAP